MENVLPNRTFFLGVHSASEWTAIRSSKVLVVGKGTEDSEIGTFGNKLQNHFKIVKSGDIIFQWQELETENFRSSKMMDLFFCECREFKYVECSHAIIYPDRLHLFHIS